MLLHSHNLTRRNTFRHIKLTWMYTSGELSATRTLQKTRTLWSTINHTSRGARGPDQLTSPAHECQGSWRRSRVTELRSCFFYLHTKNQPWSRGWRNAQITSNASSVSTNSQQLTNWFELFLSELGRRTCRLGSRGVLGWWGRVRRGLGGVRERRSTYVSCHEWKARKKRNTN